MKLTLFMFITFLGLSFVVFAQDAETKLKEKGIVLTPPSSPVANYVNTVRVGNLHFLAGRGPQNPITTE